MFFIIFPVNKDVRYSTLFARVQRFMKVIACVAMTSGIVNIKFTGRGGLFNSKWGQTLIIGAMTSVFVYIHIMMPNRAKTTAPPGSSILIRSIHSSRKNTNIINDRTNSQRGISKRFIPWLLFTLLTTTIALMVAASNNLF